jgi:proliferating cell nuclear antigen PCNA
MELSNIELLKESIPIIAEIIDEGVFKVNKNGLSLLTPDRAMVAVVDFKLLSTAFDEFKVDADASLGLNLANLVAILKRVKGTDKMTFESDEKSNKLKITLKGNGVRTFEVPLIDIKTENPPVSQLNFTSKIELQSEVLEEGISDADVIGDSVVLQAGGSAFKMHAKGDISSTELSIQEKDRGMHSIKTTGDVKARYPLEYLKKMIKAGKLSKNLVLEFGADYPMRISFVSLDKMSLSFVLAPRVEE